MSLERRERVGPISNMDYGRYVGDRYIHQNVLQKIESGRMATMIRHECTDQEGRKWITDCSTEDDGTQVWQVDSNFPGSSSINSSHTFWAKSQPDGGQKVTRQKHEQSRADGTSWIIEEDGEGFPAIREMSTPIGELEVAEELMIGPDSERLRFPVAETGWKGSMYTIGVFETEEDGGTINKPEDGITVTWVRKKTDGKSVITGTLHRCGTPSEAIDECCSNGADLDLSDRVRYDDELEYTVPQDILDLVALSN